MTLTCCPDCRLRFTPAAAAYLPACPQCGKPLQPVTSVKETIGFRLYKPEDLPRQFPQAIATALPTPDIIRDWS
jgi:predicted amidophosphoribosyltransferase